MQGQPWREDESEIDEKVEFCYEKSKIRIRVGLVCGFWVGFGRRSIIS